MALLLLLAERVSHRLSGIILAFPSTSAIGYFFLGWTLSPDAVSEIISFTFIPLGLSTLFPVLYIYSAEVLGKWVHAKRVHILLSFLASISIWLVCAFSVIAVGVSSITVGLGGFTVLAILGYVLLHRRSYAKPVPLTYTRSQLIGRSVFVGSILVVVVFLGKTLGPVWGGIFAMFPAVLSSSLMVLHWYYQPESLFPMFQKVSLGSLVVVVYSLTVMVVFPAVGIVLGTLVAYGVSLVTLVILFRIQPKSELEL